MSFHRYRLNHLLAMERVRTRLATDLHDDLGAGLAEIAILSEVAKRQERPRTMELLDGIAGRARSLRESMTDIVWTVDPRADSLADLVLRLRQTAFTLLETDERWVEFLAPSDDQLAIRTGAGHAPPFAAVLQGGGNECGTPRGGHGCPCRNLDGRRMSSHVYSRQRPRVRSLAAALGTWPQ